jgi:hypothetical protein
MSSIQDIYELIAAERFCERTLHLIDEQVNDIQNETRDFPRFNLSEHAGLCKSGQVLIGASIIAGYATRSLTASSHAEGSQGGPANWQIDERQEQELRPYILIQSTLKNSICSANLLPGKTSFITS